MQNTPPIFTGAMAGRVMEDSPVGTLVMVIQARDGDLGKPREVKLSLLSSELSFVNNKWFKYSLVIFQFVLKILEMRSSWTVKQAISQRLAR